jgi:hypothetical protein
VNLKKEVGQMSVFSEIITKALNDYKLILKKNLSSSKKAAKLAALGLKRQQLKQANDVGLYKKAQQVLQDLEQSIEFPDDNTPSWYCGLHEFYKYLQAILADYYLQQNTVIHITQQSSRALVDAIQLMGLADKALDTQIAGKLDQCGQTVARFGSKEQQEKLAYALKLHKGRNTSFFLPLLDNFEKYLSQ